MGCSAGCERALPPIEWRCRSRELRCEHSGTKGVRRLAYLHGVQHAPRAPMGWRGTRHRVGRSYSPRCNRSCCTRPTEFACWSPEARRKSAKIRQPCKRDRGLLTESVTDGQTDRRTDTRTGQPASLKKEQSKKRKKHAEKSNRKQSRTSQK